MSNIVIKTDERGHPEVVGVSVSGLSMEAARKVGLQISECARLKSVNTQLLAALENLDAHFDFGGDLPDGYGGFENVESVNAAFAQARAAIASAHGGTDDQAQ